ncbi:lactonase family protein [Roseibacillus ishigakijimensis]|uniref:Beta-propeller fold lactonase family protein n=1 Tax=Roseibacillus ishigakijimensis TaxID=454146 RepID=A0A934RQ91_9BACT|nr:beta-propeller fold lactonase family protein [Roseibacillus ishigakijimensis]MBK1834985.1 beta-propeller fold lactonase family protein [Roseibacillus ishigakijimensis]
MKTKNNFGWGLLTASLLGTVGSVQADALYVASNKAEGNTLVGFAQQEDGSLEKIGEFETGGKGTGKMEIFDGGYDATHPLADGIDPLISAYGLFKTPDDRFLLVVNSGDGTVSSLAVGKDYQLEAVSTVKAAAAHPLSIAVSGDLVYVASAGKGPTPPPFTGNLSGFRIDSDGKLSPIEDSIRDLGARPSCVAFTPDGKHLVVDELVTGLVKVFAVGKEGRLSQEPVSQVASPHAKEEGRWLAIPVGFDLVQKGESTVVLVSEARFLNNQGELRKEEGKVPQAPLYSWQTSSTSSYLIDSEGKIKLVSGDVLTGKEQEGGQIANCWVEISADGDTLWAANALSSSLSSYQIGDEGTLTLRDEATFKDEKETLFFSDLYLNSDGKYLNQLIGNSGEVLVLKVGAEDTLEKVGLYGGGLPEIGAYGLISVK